MDSYDGVQNVWSRGPASPAVNAEDQTLGDLYSEASSSEYDVVPEVVDENLHLSGDRSEIKRFVKEVVCKQEGAGTMLEPQVAADGGKERDVVGVEENAGPVHDADPRYADDGSVWLNPMD